MAVHYHKISLQGDGNISLLSGTLLSLAEDEEYDKLHCQHSSPISQLQLISERAFPYCFGALRESEGLPWDDERAESSSCRGRSLSYPCSREDLDGKSLQVFLRTTKMIGGLDKAQSVSLRQVTPSEPQGADNLLTQISFSTGEVFRQAVDRLSLSLECSNPKHGKTVSASSVDPPLLFTRSMSNGLPHCDDSERPAKQLSSETVQSEPKFLTLLSVVAAYFWIGPLVVVFWANTWTIYDHYVFSSDTLLSAWVCAAFGYTVFTIASLLQNHFLDFSAKRKKLVRILFMRVYSYIMCLACVCQWRGLWYLVDHYLGKSFVNATVTFSVASLCLLLLRCYRATHGPPSIIVTDFPHVEYYQMTTYFNVQSGKLRIFLDTTFTVLVVESMGVSVWRGFWMILDHSLCPDDDLMRAIWCLVISFGLGFVLRLFQYPVSRVAACLETVHWLLSLIVEDIVVVLYTIVAITSWRGFWMLQDLYFPYRPHSLWVAHSLSFLLLALSLAANSILVRGCPRDGELPNGEGLIYDTFYLTKLCSKAGPCSFTKTLTSSALDQRTHSDV